MVRQYSELVCMRNGSVLLIVSIDTEEDNWNRSRHDVTVENIQELRTQAALFDRWGVRPTYFTTYQVATDPEAADVMREVTDGAARRSVRTYIPGTHLRCPRRSCRAILC